MISLCAFVSKSQHLAKKPGVMSQQTGRFSHGPEKHIAHLGGVWRFLVVKHTLWGQSSVDSSLGGRERSLRFKYLTYLLNHMCQVGFQTTFCLKHNGPSINVGWMKESLYSSATSFYREKVGRLSLDKRSQPTLCWTDSKHFQLCGPYRPHHNCSTLPFYYESRLRFNKTLLMKIGSEPDLACGTIVYVIWSRACMLHLCSVDLKLAVIFRTHQ